MCTSTCDQAAPAAQGVHPTHDTRASAPAHAAGSAAGGAQPHRGAGSEPLAAVQVRPGGLGGGGAGAPCPDTPRPAGGPGGGDARAPALHLPQAAADRIAGGAPGPADARRASRYHGRLPGRRPHASAQPRRCPADVSAKVYTWSFPVLSVSGCAR
eukprot:scaffold4012_cov109-Isochrysis_galbana.AAC.5